MNLFLKILHLHQTEAVVNSLEDHLRSIILTITYLSLMEALMINKECMRLRFLIAVLSQNQRKVNKFNKKDQKRGDQTLKIIRVAHITFSKEVIGYLILCKFKIHFIKKEK